MLETPESCINAGCPDVDHLTRTGERRVTSVYRNPRLTSECLGLQGRQGMEGMEMRKMERRGCVKGVLALPHLLRCFPEQPVDRLQSTMASCNLMNILSASQEVYNMASPTT